MKIGLFILAMVLLMGLLLYSVYTVATVDKQKKEVADACNKLWRKQLRDLYNVDEKNIFYINYSVNFSSD